MKVFKRVYFSAMAILVALAIVFSFVIDSASPAYKKIYSDAFYSNVETHLAEIAKDKRNEFSSHLVVSRDYIFDALTGFVNEVDSRIDEEDDLTLANVNLKGGKPDATLTMQSTLVLDETQRLIPFDSVVISAAKTVHNIIVYLPGTATKADNEADAVLFTAHYDSVNIGASDNAAAVAGMLESVRYIIENEVEHENDLIFVFTDAKEQGALGAFTFKNQFKGFNNTLTNKLDNIVERIALAIDFSSMGATDKIMLVDSNVNDAKIIKALSKSSVLGYSLNSVMNYANNNGSRISDFDAFSDVAALGFANVGETFKSKTTLDAVNDTSINLACNIANMINSLSKEFGNANIADLSTGSGAVYFNYLGLNIAYPNAVSYTLAGVIVLLIAAVVILNMRKKAFSFMKMVIALMVQAMTILATIVLLYACYFVVTLLLAGFGVIPINIISSVIYANPAIILLIMVLAGAIMTVLYVVLKKAFNLNAGDVVRGNALIWVLLGLIFGFAATKVGYVFVIGALLNLIVTVVFIALRDKYNSASAASENSKSRLGGIGGLFMYVWASILVLPLVISVVMLATGYVAAVVLPLLAVLLMLLLGAAVPYADYLKPIIDKGFSKLPKRKITRRVKVIERQEDRAKKGKFSDVEVIKKETIEIERKYTNSLGVFVVGIICIISLVLASAFGASFNTNFTAWKTFDNSIYDGAIVYEWEKHNDGSISTNLVVADPMAYRFISNYVTGYSWDSDKGAYIKEYNNAVFGSTWNQPSVSKSGDVFSFTVYESTRGRVIITLSGVSGYSTLTFKDSDGEERFVYNNTKSEDEIEFKLPRGFGDFTITAEGSASQVNVKYQESVFGNPSGDNILDVLSVREGIEKSGKENDDFKSGIVLKFETTV